MLLFNNLISFFTGLEGRPASWQVTFQAPATPIMEGIIDAHGEIVIYLILILSLICSLFIYVIFCFINFQSDETKIIADNWNIKSSKTVQLIEFVWTIIPTLLLIVIGLPSFSLLFALEEINNCVETDLSVTAVGRQWYWVYFYEDAIPLFFDNLVRIAVFESYMTPADELDNSEALRLLQTTEPLVIPTKKFVKLKITADDVIHSWTVPSFGIKLDAIPGRLNTTILYVPYIGTYFGQCSELCGVNHAYMPIHVNVVSAEDFKAVFFGDVMKVNLNPINFSNEEEEKIKSVETYINN
jgi:cytochrome c oxidase subunit 2